MTAVEERAPDVPALLPGSPLRVGVWLLHVALPALGLWLLIAQPALDVHWQHNGAHFWLVNVVAAVNFWLALLIAQAARKRTDARLFLVAGAFLCSAGFLLLHGLATPGVLVGGPNAGFVLAQPVGLVPAAVLAALSALELSPRVAARVTREGTVVLAAILGLVLGWAAVSLLGLPPLDAPLPAERAAGPLAVMALLSIPLFLLAAARYWLLHRRRPAVMLVSLATAFVLLAEAMAAVTFARNWALSWWLWHVLLVFAFGFVAYSAHVQYRREGTATGLFDGVGLSATVRRLRAEQRAALDALVDELRRRAEGPDEDAAVVATRLAERFGLSEAQATVMEQAGAALADEQTQNERLQGLVAVGQAVRVGLAERELLATVLDRAARGFPRERLRIGLVEDGRLAFPAELVAGPETAGGQTLAVDVTVHGTPAGVLEATRARGGFADRDHWALQALAAQLSVSLENTRLYATLDGLFRQYLAPEVADRLLADPQAARLGGDEREVTVLFADLRGFTPFAERSRPEQVMALLNRYYRAAVPGVLDAGGTVIQLVGDELMAVFNAPVPQDDHAARALRAAAAIHRSIAPLAADEPGLPRFGIGVHTGTALVGNIGSEQFRVFTAIGDTTNLAARLQARAGPGETLVSDATWARIGGTPDGRPQTFEVKGRTQPVTAFLIPEREEP